MNENDTSSNGNAPPKEEPAQPAEDTKFVLDDELSSAASPFLFLLPAVLIAVAAYFVYRLLRG